MHPASMRGRLPRRKANKNAARTGARAACLSVFPVSPTSVSTRTEKKTTRAAQAASIAFYPSGNRLGPVSRPEPARDGHGESPSSTSRDDHVNLVGRRELGHQRVGMRRCPPESQVRTLAVAIVGNELGIGPADGVVKMALQIASRPAVVGEGARMLGTHHEHGV